MIDLKGGEVSLQFGSVYWLKNKFRNHNGRFAVVAKRLGPRPNVGLSESVCKTVVAAVLQTDSERPTLGHGPKRFSLNLSPASILLEYSVGQTDLQPIVDCTIGAHRSAPVAPVGVAGLGSGSLAPPLPAAWFSQ